MINTHAIVSHTLTTVSDVHRGVVDTHAIVSGLGHDVASTHMMISDIHRTVVKDQGENDSQNSLVSGSRVIFTPGCSLTVA